MDDFENYAMRSLRRTTLIWMTSLLVVIGLVAFAISYGVALQEAAGFLDGQLRQIALNTGEVVAETNNMDVKHDPEDDFVISIWDLSGKSLRQSDANINLPIQNSPGFATVQAQGEDWRVFLVHGSQRIVQVGQRMSVRQEMAESAALQAAAPILLVIPLAWLLIGWALGKLLERVSSLSIMIAEKSTESKEPIPVENLPAELRPLVDAMNILTGRLQHAMDEQKRFVADAAHELRTPLTALQLQLVNLKTQTSGLNEHLVEEMGGGIKRISLLVHQLLSLARFDERGSQPPLKRLNLTELVTDCIADLIPLAEAKNVDLGRTESDKAHVLGVTDDLRALFSNILDNSIRYTPDEGSIDVAIRVHEGNVTVEVQDSGIGVDEKDIPRLFDRFFRSAPLDIDGNGLGLSIAAAVAKRHKLSIIITNRTDRSGLRVRVVGPITEIV